MQRRFISAEACSAWAKSSKFQASPHLINPVRNAELVQYQEGVKQARRKFAEELRSQPTKAQIEAERKAKNREAGFTKWNSTVEATKRKVESLLASTTAQNLAQKHHPCRPSIKHLKTPEERAQNQERLAEALRPALIYRRKYVTMLAEDSSKWVRREDLASKIDWAISHPVAYETPVERTLDVENTIRARLNTIRVPDEAGRL